MPHLSYEDQVLDPSFIDQAGRRQRFTHGRSSKLRMHFPSPRTVMQGGEPSGCCAAAGSAVIAVSEGHHRSFLGAKSLVTSTHIFWSTRLISDTGGSSGRRLENPPLQRWSAPRSRSGWRSRRPWAPRSPNSSAGMCPMLYVSDGGGVGLISMCGVWGTRGDRIDRGRGVQAVSPFRPEPVRPHRRSVAGSSDSVSFEENAKPYVRRFQRAEGARRLPCS